MKKEYKLKEMKGYRRPGKPKATADATVPKTFRMPVDVLNWLETEGKKTGVGYQTAMLLILRREMQHGSGLELAAQLTEMQVREIVRDELQRKQKAG
jgi:uncharacterized protein (DUF4415 family)